MFSTTKPLSLVFLLVITVNISVHGETWNELLNRADSLSLAQNTDSALVLGKRALKLAEKDFGNEDTTVASILHLIGVFSYERANYDEAVEFYKKALAIWEKILGPEHVHVARSLNNLANVYQAEGEYTEGEPLLKRAVAIWEKALGADHSNVAVGLVNLANLTRLQGRYAEAEPLYKKSLAIFEKALDPEHPNVAYSLNYLAALYWEQGKYAEAELLHKRALAIREKTLGSDHPFVAHSLNNLANIYYVQGRYAEAEPLYKRSMTICEKVLDPEHPYVATALGNLANLYCDQRKYVKAEFLYKKTLAIEEETLGPEHPEVALSVDNLAGLYWVQDRYAEAESLYKRALTIRKAALGPKHPYVAYSLNGLANLYTDQGRYAEAELLYKRSLAIREKALGPKHPDVAGGLEDFSTYYRLQKDSKTFLQMSSRAFEIRQKNFQDNGYVLSEKDALTYSEFMWNSANNYLSCYFGAKLDQASMIGKTSNIVLASKGQVSDDIFRRHRSLVTETDSVTLSLAESLRHTKFQLSQLYVTGPGDDTTGAYRHHFDSLSNLANELESDLARRSASFRKLQSYRNISADRIASLLPKKSVLLEYLKYNYYQLKPDSTIPRYLVVALDEKPEPFIVDLGEASEIDSLISDYRKHMLRVSSQQHMPLREDKADYEVIARKLYDSLLGPVGKCIANSKLVFIAPDGGLNLISFAGIIDDEGRYLIENTPIHYLSAGRDLLRLQYREEPGNGLFALGDPDYDATGTVQLAQALSTEHLPNRVSPYLTRNVRSGCGDLREITVEPLPSTRGEIEQVVKQWVTGGNEQVIVCVEREASEDNFKAKAPGRRAIHLATHGYYLEGICNPAPRKSGLGMDQEFIGENPLLQSGLFFSGANLHGKLADSLGFDDGILTAYEVSAMDLRGTDLVVLSACETGLGEVKEGEGIYGLRRAFQMAGARTVVSALWPVSDRTTAEMMGQLYGQSKKPLPERIRQMQLAQIKKLRTQGLSDHPYNWAGFIALGDWR